MTSFKFLFLSTLFYISALGDQDFQKISLNQNNTHFPFQRMLQSSLPTATSYNYLFPSVPVNLGSASQYQPELESSGSTMSMQIIISASESGLGAVNTSCTIYMASYHCETSFCTEDTSPPQSIAYPFFSSTDVTTLNLSESAIISIANGAWKLAASSPLYIHSCDAPNPAPATSGWLGLGTSGNASLNFETPNPIFSVYLQTESNTFDLIFGYNSSLVSDTLPSTTLISDSDWKLSITGLSLGGVQSNFSQAIPLIFDVTTDRLWLPEAEYVAVMNYLAGLPTLACSVDNDKSDFSDNADLEIELCPYNGDISVLPTLDFILANGTVFSLPPAAYLLSTGTEGSGYSTIFEAFNATVPNQNYTVIGTRVMANYYSVFSKSDAGINTITLYPLFTETDAADTDFSDDESPVSNTPSSSHKVVAIVVPVVVLVLVICIVVFVGYKKGWWCNKKKNSTEDSSLNLEVNTLGANAESSEGVLHSEL